MNNPLTMIPPAVRRWLYLGLFLAGVVLGALQLAGVHIGNALQVLAYVGSALGIVAAPNVPARSRKHKGQGEGV